MKQYTNLMLDQERALYGIKNAEVRHCVFDGPADGESALKEAGSLHITDCDFRLRYPLWHVDHSTVESCRMTEDCRAALWYNKDIRLLKCTLGGIKAVREGRSVELEECQINSSEFGWKCRDLVLNRCSLVSEYPFLDCQNVKVNRLDMKAKYSFQYVKNLSIRHSVLDTKDAFWHSENVTVEDSIVKGEYLGWYSKNLTFTNCKIIGTQPLCYAKNLVLKNCEMKGADLAFEYSEVQADVITDIVSVKNPHKGYIRALHIGEIILDENRLPGSNCQILQQQPVAA